jgi:hypothetical protein
MAKELEEFDSKELAFDTLSSQFQKPEFTKIANVLGAVFDEINETHFYIKDGFDVETAVENELTILGKVWDAIRGGKDDPTLRAEIKVNAARVSSGTFPELKAALLTQFGGSLALLYNLYAAGEEAAYIAVTDAVITQKELEDISAAGVGVYFGSFLIGEDGSEIISEADGDNIIGIG